MSRTGMGSTRIVVVSACVAGGCSMLTGVTAGIATPVLPRAWHPYLWMFWPITGVLTVAFIVATVIGIGRAGAESADETIGDAGTAARRLLTLQYRSWVETYLANLPEQVARKELNMLADAANLWTSSTTRYGGERRPVPPNTPVSTVYDGFERGMLILAEPGGGKTVTILELLRDLIDRARTGGEHERLPVYLSLASWPGGPLEEWLATELRGQYQVDARFTGSWVAEGRLALLLDGLDEVAAERRAACVTAVNDFLHARRLNRVVVSSRTGEYDPLAAVQPLDVDGTLSLEPLSRKQITAYLRQAGRAGEGARAALDADPELWELVTSPQLLSVLILAYRGSSSTARKPDPRRRDRLFGAYVRTMLSVPHRGTRLPGGGRTTEGFVACLAFIAASLRRQSQTVFHPDLVDGDWLPTRPEAYYRFANAVFGAAGVGVLGGFGLLVHGWVGALAGAAIGLTFGYPTDHRLDAYSVNSSRRTMSGPDAASRRPVWLESLRDAFDVRAHPVVLALAANTGLLVGPLLGDTPLADLGYGLATGLAIAVTGLLSLGLTWPLHYRDPSDSSAEVPSPQLRAMLRVGVVLVALTSAVAGVTSGAIVGLFDRPTDGLRFGTLVSLAAGLYAISSVGGLALVHQYVIRLRLRRLGLLPLPARAVLDEATRRVLLRRVGTGYLFVHRSLLEFFADLAGADGKPDPARIREMLAEPVDSDAVARRTVEA